MTSPDAGPPTSGSWFASLGQALTPAMRADIEALLRLHPLVADAGIATVASWREAASILADEGWDTRWSDHEETERERLWLIGADRLGEDALFALVTEATRAHVEAIREAAARAAQREAIDDARLVAAASGAATMALQHALLAREAGEEATHYFPREYALYRGGRWPLGYHRARYCVF